MSWLPKEESLHKINNILSVVVVLVALLVLLFPLFPQISFAVEGQFEDRAESSEKKYGSDLTQNKVAETDGKDGIEVPEENTLVVPSIGVDGTVYEGGKEALGKGMWRRPNSSTPDVGGNTVIVAHRFLFTSGPNTFYHLDKVREDDIITLFWDGEIYQYNVTEVFEVTPDQVEIEADTEEPILTLYTCTPLWTAHRRLVVRAELL